MFYFIMMLLFVIGFILRSICSGDYEAAGIFVMKVVFVALVATAVIKYTLF